jgi:hypothetical protein
MSGQGFIILSRNSIEISEKGALRYHLSELFSAAVISLYGAHLNSIMGQIRAQSSFSQLFRDL